MVSAMPLAFSSNWKLCASPAGTITAQGAANRMIPLWVITVPRPWAIWNT